MFPLRGTEQRWEAMKKSRNRIGILVIAAIATMFGMVGGTPRSDAGTTATQGPLPKKAGPLTTELELLANPQSAAAKSNNDSGFVAVTSGPGTPMIRPDGSVLVEVRVSITNDATLERLRDLFGDNLNKPARGSLTEAADAFRELPGCRKTLVQRNANPQMVAERALLALHGALR